MTEVIFLVQEDANGVWDAQAIGFDMITQADSTEELKKAITEALQCHFEPDEIYRPWISV
jgi:predicted RNase H-like HicB family nuclease